MSNTFGELVHTRTLPTASPSLPVERNNRSLTMQEESPEAPTRLVGWTDSRLEGLSATSQRAQTPEAQALRIAESAVKLHELQRWEEACAQYLKAIEHYEQLNDASNWKTVARLHNNLAMVLRELNRATEAEDHYVEALVAYDAAAQKDVAEEIALLLGNLAYLHFDCGNYQDALKVQQRALAVSRLHLANETVTIGQDERRAGIFAYFAEQPDLAVEHLERGLGLMQRCGEEKINDQIDLLVNLAAAHLKRKDHDKALKISGQAVQLLAKCKGDNDLLLAAVLNNIGCLQLRQKNALAALDALNWSLRILKSHPVSDDTSRAEAYHNLALAHTSLGNEASAKLYRKFATELFHSISEDCRAKLQIAVTQGEAVVSTSSTPVANTESSFMRQPVRISQTSTVGSFVLPMKTETIEWDH